MAGARAIVAYEGNIASGKSCLLSRLRAYINAQRLSNDVQVLLEPVAQWETSFNAYEQGKMSAFQLQGVIQDTLDERVRLAPRTRLLLTERSLEASAKVFIPTLIEIGVMTPEQAHRLLTTLPVHPVKARVFIQSDPAICWERVQTRGQTGDRLVNLEYLQHLQTHYEDWLTTASQPMLTLSLIHI